MKHTAFHRALFKMLDALFPPRADELLVRTANERDLTRLSGPHLAEANGVLYALPFQHKLTRAVIHEAKFHHNKRALALLATVLSKHLIKTPFPKGTRFIPIPLGTSRARARGYNQVEVVIEKALAECHDTYILDTKSLLRVKETRPQTSLPKHVRKENMRNAFSTRDGSTITGAHIILIDDVTTTGATLHAAKAALLPRHPASITLLALAH